ncbi:type II toxin-antitoxin system HicA family toxin [Thermus sp.]
MRRRLEAAGFAVYTQKGSHVKFLREEPDGLCMVIVPPLGNSRGDSPEHPPASRAHP